MSKNLRGLSERKGLEQGLYEEIVAAMGEGPGLNDKNPDAIAERFLVGKSLVPGVSSFYDFLSTEHRGKKVFVCDGTACLTSGRQEELKMSLLERYSEDEIGTVSCLGYCHSNNAYLGDHGVWSAEDHKPALKEIFTGSNAVKPALLEPTGGVKDYYSVLTQYNDLSGALNEIELSGLRGRGGAGFPFHLKVKTSLEAKSDKKYVVCNADEGDPGAFSDKWLLEERPHSVLFGMLLTGLITGADTGVLYIRGEYPGAVDSVKEAVRQFEVGNIINALLPGQKFRFFVVEGSGAYICGDETSLLNSLEGLRPEVRTRPPFPALYGLFGKPTVLSNVETFANLRYIMKEGGAAYAALGTEKSPGTKLVCLDGAFNRPGLYEVRMGTPLKEVLYGMGGGTRFPVKAFQVGGPLGGIVPTSKVDDLTLDFESFSREGFLLGHAGIVSVPEDFPVIKLLTHLFEFTEKESCGKCFPCRIGSLRGMEMLTGASEKGEKIDRQLFDDLLETMQLGSLCALGGGLPLPLKNALQYFSSELDGYFTSNTLVHE